LRDLKCLIRSLLGISLLHGNMRYWSLASALLLDVLELGAAIQLLYWGVFLKWSYVLSLSLRFMSLCLRCSYRGRPHFVICIHVTVSTHAILLCLETLWNVYIVLRIALLVVSQSHIYILNLASEYLRTYWRSITVNWWYFCTRNWRIVMLFAISKVFIQALCTQKRLCFMT